MKVCCIFSMSTRSIIRLLINAGANVDELEPRTKSTPLHLIASSHDVDAAVETIRILLDANAHLDYVDYQGLRPEDVADNFEIRDYLRVNRQLSLKCQCAHLIAKNRICYKDALSARLIQFVHMHDKTMS